MCNCNYGGWGVIESQNTVMGRVAKNTRPFEGKRPEFSCHNYSSTFCHFISYFQSFSMGVRRKILQCLFGKSFVFTGSSSDYLNMTSCMWGFGSGGGGSQNYTRKL